MIELLPIPRDVLAHIIINTVFMLIAIIAVALRLVARRLKGIALGLDDYFIVAAVPFAIGMLVIQGLYGSLGAGYEITDVPLENFTLILKLLLAYQLIWVFAMVNIKMSIMLFYLRIFINEGLRFATKIVMAVTLLWSVGNILQVFLICRPFRSTYDITVPGVCGNRTGSFVAICTFNIVTDFIILGLPIRTVWKLQMATSTKIALTAVFCIGLVVTIVALVRLVSLAQINFTNLTGTMKYPSFWSATEPILAILSVSLPMLRPILVYLWPDRFGRDTEGSSRDPGQKTLDQIFERLNDSTSSNYPLDQIYTGPDGAHGKANVTSNPDEVEESSWTRPRSHKSSAELRSQHIAVKREWQVTSTS